MKQSKIQLPGMDYPVTSDNLAPPRYRLHHSGEYAPATLVTDPRPLARFSTAELVDELRRREQGDG